MFMWSFLYSTSSKKFEISLDEHTPLKSNHQTTDVVKDLYTYLGHFMDFKNPLPRIIN